MALYGLEKLRMLDGFIGRSGGTALIWTDMLSSGAVVFLSNALLSEVKNQDYL